MTLKITCQWFIRFTWIMQLIYNPESKLQLWLLAVKPVVRKRPIWWFCK